MSAHKPGGRRPWPSITSIALVALAACGEGGSSGGRDDLSPTLAYVAARCRDEASGDFVFGPETLQTRRGNGELVTLAEVPASTPVAGIGLCRVYGLGRHGPGTLAAEGALTRVGISPDGSVVVFEVTDEFSRSPRNLTPEDEQIFSVRYDGSDMRALGPPSRGRPGGFNGFRFSPDGRTIVFNDKGPDHVGSEASQVVVLDLETGERRQVTQLSRGASASDDLCCPRFVDDKTIAFGTTLNADGSHPDGGVFTIGIDDMDIKAVSVPVVIPGSGVDYTFVITGDQPAAASLSLEGAAVNPHDGFNEISEVFLIDGANLLQLTPFRRVDTFNGLLNVDRQSVFFTASANPLDTNAAENCQLFAVDVDGLNLRQLTSFREGPHSAKGCRFNLQGARKPFGCHLGRLFQDPVTQTVAFFSSCDPFGSNPNGVQVFSVQPDGTDLRQLTNLRGIVTDADGTFAAELLGPFAYPGQGSAFGQ